MTQINVKTPNGYLTLDSPQIDVQLNLGVRDLKDLRPNSAPYSISFDLPFSNTNVEFFKSQNVIAATGTLLPGASEFEFQLYKETQCQLVEEGTVIQDGILQCTAIDVQNQAFRCTFFGRNASLYGRMKGKSWYDIFLKEDGTLDDGLNHALTDLNVQLSWNTTGADITQDNVGFGTIVYMFTDVGHSADNFPDAPAFGDPILGTGWFDSANYTFLRTNLEGFRPGIRVKYLITYVIERLGLFLQPGGFFDNVNYNIDDLYMVIGTEHEVLIREANSNFCVNNDDGTNTPFGQEIGSVPVFLPMNDTAPSINPLINAPSSEQFQEFQNPGAVVLPSGYFIAPQAGTYQFQVAFAISSADVSANGNGTIRIWRGGGAQLQLLYSDPLYVVAAPTGVNNSVSEFTFSVSLQAGNLVNLIMEIENSAGSTYATYVAWRQVAIFNDYNPSGNIDVLRNLPSTTVEQWFQAIVDKFNLVVETEPQTNEVKILAYDDWTGANSPIDWTDRIDQAGRFLITPANQLQKRQVVFEDAPGTDILNATTQAQANRVKGFTNYNSESDWAQGEQRVGDYFAPFRQAFLPGGPTPAAITAIASNIVITSLWNKYLNVGTFAGEVEFESGPPILAFFHGVTDATDHNGDAVSYYIGFSAGITDVPLWGPNNRLTNPEFTLDFASTYQDLDGFVGMANLGTAQFFYLSYLDEIYDTEARILDCVAYLKPQDIQNLNFGTYIIIENLRFRLLRISNYVVGGDGRCDLTLLKSSLGSSLSCELIPNPGEDGIVRWTDAAGAAVDGNAFCCQRYGWTWNANNNTCYVPGNDGAANRTALPIGTAPNGGPTQSIANTGTATVLGSLNGIRGVRSVFSVQALCERATPAPAFTSLKQRYFQLGNEISASVKITFSSVVVSGPNLGDMEFGEYTAALETVNFVTTVAQGDVFNRKGGSFVAIDVDDRPEGSRFQIICTGKSLDDEQFDCSVEVVTFRRKGADVQTQALWQDNAGIVFQDGTPMQWNP